MRGEKEFKKFVNVLQFQTALEAILLNPFETFKNVFVLQKQLLSDSRRWELFDITKAFGQRLISLCYLKVVLELQLKQGIRRYSKSCLNHQGSARRNRATSFQYLVDYRILKSDAIRKLTLSYVTGFQLVP